MSQLDDFIRLGMYGQQNAQNQFGLGLGQSNQQPQDFQNAQAYHQNAPAQTPPTKPPEKKSMFKEIATDVKGFVLEHRSIIYFIAFALLLDHVFFKGAFKARLQGMADKIVAKVEAKI